MNLLYTAAQKLNRLLHWFYHPITVGVRAIVLNREKDAVLLVKLSYADGWYLPGGGLKKNESITDGLKRELKEELGFTVDEETVSLLGVYNNFSEGKSDSIVVAVCTGEIEPYHRDFEVEKQQYFRLDALPDSLSPGTKRRLDEYLQHSSAQIGRW